MTPRGHHDIDVKLKGVQVKQVKQQKVLGIVLDENLDFKAHVEESATRAMRALNKISVLSNSVGGASAEVMLLLYKGCVLPLLEYGYAVWCSARNKDELEKVQHAALTRILGAAAHTNGAAMEILANVMPLEFRLQSSLLNSFLRIFRKPDGDSLKTKIQELRINPNFITMHKTTSLSMLQMAEYYLSDFSLEHIEPYIYETMDDITKPNSNMKLVITQHKIGSSGNRTAAQQKKAQEIAEQYLVDASNDAIAFTDGSALPNPGPCGAGICVHWAGISADSTEISIPVAKRSTSYHGELKAIETIIKLAAERNYTGTLHILSDCQSALHTAMAPDIPANFSALSQSIKKHAQEIQGTINLIWVAGHADIAGNECADRLAKEAATKAANDDDLPIDTISHSEAKARIKLNAIKMWKTRWARQNNGKSFQQELDPKRRIKHFHPQKTESKIYRLILQHNNLEENLHKMYPDKYPTPSCVCNTGIGDTEHFIQRCPIFAKEREAMHDAIYGAYHANNIDPTLRVTDTHTILGLNKSTPATIIPVIANALGSFIRSSNKSI